MFTDKLTKIFLSAKNRAASLGHKSVDLESVLAAMGTDFEASPHLADCLTDGDVAAFRKLCPAMGKPVPCPKKNGTGQVSGSGTCNFP